MLTVFEMGICIVPGKFMTPSCSNSFILLFGVPMVIAQLSVNFCDFISMTKINTVTVNDNYMCVCVFVLHPVVAVHCWYNREGDCCRQLRAVQDFPS
jgi:heme/copper-type cytochrome/quinol oxidase subunit 4